MHSRFVFLKTHFYLKLAALSVFVMLPLWWLLWQKYPVWYDFALRSMLLNESSKQFWQGEFYPRWLVDVNDGLGSPVMLFQPNFTNYFAVFLQPLAQYDPNGYGRVLILINAFLLLGGVGAYKWLSQHFDDISAKAGAMLYCIFPINLYSIYAVTHQHRVLAVMLYPWFLYFLSKMIFTRSAYVILVAVAQACLTLTSLWGALIFSLFPVFYLFAVSKSPAQFKHIVMLGFAQFLGVIIAGIYWYPLLMNKDYISYSDFTLPQFMPANNFLEIFKSEDRHTQSYWIPWINILTCIVPLAITLMHFNRQDFLRWKKEICIFSTLIFLAILMALDLSSALWEALPFISNIQFPSRFINAVIPAIVFLVCCGIKRHAGFQVFLTVSTLILLFQFLFVANNRYTDLWDADWANMINRKIVPQPSHHTVWMRQAMGIYDILPPDRFLDVAESQVINGDVEISNTTYRSRSIEFDAKVRSDTSIVSLKRYFYPGWLISSPTASEINIMEHDALLSIMMPKGEHHILLSQPWYEGEKEGVLMSSSGVVVLFLWALFLWARGRSGNWKLKSPVQ